MTVAKPAPSYISPRDHEQFPSSADRETHGALEARYGATKAPIQTRRSSPEERLTPAIGVYVHFPWCLKKCPYCDFLSIASERDRIPHRAYADAVILELDRRAAVLGPRRLRSVFFGGGTPSLW